MNKIHIRNRIKSNSNRHLETKSTDTVLDIYESTSAHYRRLCIARNCVFFYEEGPNDPTDYQSLIRTIIRGPVGSTMQYTTIVKDDESTSRCIDVTADNLDYTYDNSIFIRDGYVRSVNDHIKFDNFYLSIKLVMENSVLEPVSALLKHVDKDNREYHTLVYLLSKCVDGYTNTHLLDVLYNFYRFLNCVRSSNVSLYQSKLIKKVAGKFING